jgi:hypothetical protein
MPLQPARVFPTSGKRTVSYRDSLGRTKNAVATDTSYWLAGAAVNYGALGNVTLVIDGVNVATVDLTAATNLATAITALNADGTFAAAATASDEGGQLLVTADDAGEHSISLTGTGMSGEQLLELFIGRQLDPIGLVPAATDLKQDGVYYNRVGPS